MAGNPRPSNAYLRAFAKRLQWAITAKQYLNRDFMTQGEIAKDIAKIARRKPVTSAAVSRWMAGENVPDPELTIAIAEWAGVDPGWLIAGDKCGADGPDGYK